MIYSEGEDERVLRATQVVVEERLARPILIGRPEVISDRIKRFGLAIRPDAISRSSIRATIRAIATTSRLISKWRGERA